MNAFLDPEGQQAKVEEQRRKQEEFERQMREALAFIASTPDGLLFLRGLIDMSGILKSQYPTGYAHATFNEGKRSIGAKLLNMASQAGKITAIMEDYGNGN